MITSDEKILRAPNQEVASLEEAGQLISLLEKEMALSALMGRPGIGLALPQCAINKKVAIVRIPTVGAQDISVNLVNARIEKGYEEFIFKDEGCLSFEGDLKDTKRFQEIFVVNNLVEPHSFIATGLLAVAVQHELDHTNGVLFQDRAVIKEASKARSKPRPNDPCHCGSGKKFKRCHKEIAE